MAIASGWLKFEPARLPGASELRGEVDEQFLLFAGGEMHYQAPFRAGRPPAEPHPSIVGTVM